MAGAKVKHASRTADAITRSHGDRWHESLFTPILGPPEGLVDVRPAPVALEDDLASIAAEHDLEVAPPDRSRVAPTHRAGCCFHLKRSRQGFDLDL